MTLLRDVNRVAAVSVQVEPSPEAEVSTCLSFSSSTELSVARIS